MGSYLSVPKTEKFSEDGENVQLKYGVSAMQGWRTTMEDASTAILDLDDETSFFGVYDGHGGKAVSRFCAKHLHEQLLQNEEYRKGNLSKSLNMAFLRMDEMMRGQRGWRELNMVNTKSSSKVNQFFGALVPGKGSNIKCVEQMNPVGGNHWMSEQGSHSDFVGPTSGSTAVVALIRYDAIIVANAGDSRCVLSRGGKAFNLSSNHTPKLKLERERITQAGGFIHGGRISGSLNLSRAIGDVEFKQNKLLSPDKQIITASPEIKIIERSAADEFLILASDGIWDVMRSQEVVDFIHQHVKLEPSLSAVCEKLLDYCLAPNTLAEGCDNMTAIIVQLKKHC